MHVLSFSYRLLVEERAEESGRSARGSETPVFLPFQPR